MFSKKISYKSSSQSSFNGFFEKKNGLSSLTFISQSFGFGWKPIFFLIGFQGEGWDQAWEGLQACSWRWRSGGEVWRCLSSSPWGIGDLELGKSLYTLIAFHSRIFYWFETMVFYPLGGFPCKYWCCLIVSHFPLHFIFSF